MSLLTPTFQKRNREEAIALLVLIALVILYLVAMFLWLHYEYNRPIKDWQLHDAGGTFLLYKATKAIHRKLFKRDRG